MIDFHFIACMLALNKENKYSANSSVVSVLVSGNA